MAIQYAGGTPVNTTYTAVTRQDIMSGLLTQLVAAGWTNQTAATGAGTGPGGVHTITMTIASPCVVTDTAHGWLGGERVILQTTGALPTGLSVNTVYFVKYINANTYNLAATLGGANINTTGSQSGTHRINTESVLIQTATTPQGLAVNMRIKDNRGTCIQISLENTAGTLVGANDTTNGMNLRPEAGKSFRIIANKYQFFTFVPSISGVPRNFAAGGVPYIPSPNTVPSQAGWLTSDSQSDTGTNVMSSWRDKISITSANCPNYQAMWGANMNSNNNNGLNTTNVAAALQLFCALSAAVAQIGGNVASGNPALYRWASGDVISSDSLMSWGVSAVTDEAQLRCQMWDTIIIHDSFTIDTTTSFDSHNWFCLTGPQVGSNGTIARGALLIVVP